jgi:hypothetical protein
MSQGQDWNAPGAQAYQQQPGSQAYSQAAMAPAGAVVMPGMMPPQVPPGFYYDQLSGLVLPVGTVLAPVGRRIGAWFLGGLLSVVTLGIGYAIWGLIAWSKGQTPAQQILGLQSYAGSPGSSSASSRSPSSSRSSCSFRARSTGRCTTRSLPSSSCTTRITSSSSSRTGLPRNSPAA